MIKLIKALKRHARILHSVAEQAIPVYRQHSSTQEHFVNELLQCIRQFYTWATNLPELMSVLEVIPWPMVELSMNTLVGLIKTRFNLYYHTVRASDPFSQNTWLLSLMKTCWHESMMIDRLLNRLYRLPHKITGFLAVSHTPALVMASVQAQIPLSLHLNIPEAPPISYTPFHLMRIVRVILRVLHNPVPNDNTVHVTLVQKPETANFWFSVPGYRMTPQGWEGLLANFNPEALHEHAISLEPLTWDEGYGQGVVLRLPWA